MKNFIPALLLLCNVCNPSVAMAQDGSGDTNASSTASQRIVLEALNNASTHAIVPQNPAQAQAAQPMTSGIGPSSNMPAPGDYGYSASSDLRQLNF